ncbi:beta-aspartyl-peptidase [Caloramator sp. E03]|uniref:beta-aspartyl-peptidase n=1 Tax=Caloramator sp. E03 TaxID=2576307 RepID=UPI001110C0C8|nr:beta-aspartyl-peptidase [Caloramator sp. E03]QCX32536.1 beta-aspartyl-peptidase [Caloramator sp. E03]
MIKLIKGVKIFSPDYLGEGDILIICDKIGAVSKFIDIDKIAEVELEIIDGTNKIAVPGFIDSHVHISGGGGEGGYKTRTPEIMLSDLIIGGITTVVGCLGTDGITRSMEGLLAKARGLEEEGITAYIYTGSYRVPITTITGSVMKDIMLIDKVIGAGEIAISDHRSSQPTIDMIMQLVADARVAGILSGKAGIVNFHLGEGGRMLNYLHEIVIKTEIPYTQFLPTHINRNEQLLNEGIKFAKAGGFIDFTTSSDSVFWEKGEVKASKALKLCIEEGVDINHITFTSDGQGSLPMFNDKKEFIGLGIGKVTSLYYEVRDAIIEDNVPFEKAIRVITSNPAFLLKLKNKGRIEKGFDADIVLVDKETLDIDTVIAKGQVMMQNKELKIRGTFEN